jgi:hypothetical protein
VICRQGRRRTLAVQEGKKDLLDDLKHGFALEGGAVQALFDLVKKPGVERLGRQAIQGLFGSVANAHSPLLPNKKSKPCSATITLSLERQLEFPS